MDDQSLLELILKVISSPSTADAWVTFHPEVAHEQLCDRFSRSVVEQYLSGALAYESADRAMNRLYAYCYHLGVDRGMPDYSWQVFEAFEEGEYKHKGDPPGTNNEETYVRPLVMQLRT